MSFHGFIIIIFLVFCINYGKASSSEEKIIGGEPVELGDLPYMTVVGNITVFCGGAIITRKHILTAAQCIYSRIVKSESFVRVHVGTLHPSGGDLHYIKHVSVHPEFLKNYPTKIVYDIGILTLCDEIIYDPDKQPVKLPREEVQDGVEAVVSGWGSIGKRNLKQQLRKVAMKVYTFENCTKDPDLALEMKNKSEICTLDTQKKGICDVDQGGPLVRNGVILGVASLKRTKDCRKKCKRGKVVFTSVYQSLDYIEDEINPLICRKSCSEKSCVDYFQ